MSELRLLVGGRTQSASLRGAVLADDLAGSSFGDPETLSKSHDSPPAALRG
jgi:hypothetical protein